MNKSVKKLTALLCFVFLGVLLCYFLTMSFFFLLKSNNSNLDSIIIGYLLISLVLSLSIVGYVEKILVLD
jgi:high-affinity Fe2+/Pb2+ permease